MLRFTGSVDGPRLAGLGTYCPDHFLRTKISRCLWTGTRRGVTRGGRGVAVGWADPLPTESNIITAAADGPVPLRCATPTPRWF